ncbi:MAG: EAL domain-containing protein [Ideonella sp.]|nr:EAL domain-containing protein [Ideonella sp.]
MALHPLLARQLRRLGIDPQAEPGGPWAALLERVSCAYTDADQERYLLERSQTLASGEMTRLNEALQAERDQLESRVRERTEALRLSEGRLANLVSLSADWIWEQDAQLRFTYVSEGFQGASGIDPVEFIGERRGASSRFEVDPEVLARHLAQIERHEPFRDFRYGYRRPDGVLCHIRISGEPIFDADERFQGYRGVGTDETQATLAAQRMQQLASYDSLCGLPNRNLFVAELERALARARRAGSSFGLCFLDLDRFKAINDTLGHAAGDELLQIMAARLRGLLRESDLIARLGGDEFVVLLDGEADVAALSAVARKLLAVISEPLPLRGRSVWITGSCGIAMYPADGDDAQTLLKNADAAMYQAKAGGKNSFHFYTAALAAQSALLFALETDLRHAIERGELVLHYQPKFDIAGGELRGIEALVRWQHPKRGLVPPLEFIPIAEDSGLIVPLGRWVLGAACRQLSQWRAAGLAIPRCAINLSARQFTSDTLIDDVLESLSAAGIAPDLLEVEITESVLMADPDRAHATLQRLHTLGVHIAIDDFGTGYSSLAYLKRFPAQTLKIDRSFVSGLPLDRDDAAITQAVIALSHSLGMQVVAEGVETQAQLDFLRGLGCDSVQGYLTGRPMTETLLAARLPRLPALTLAA